MSGRKKTVLRTFRLTAEHDKLLEDEAANHGLSVNALFTSMITKYAEWDRYLERYGFVTLGRQGYKRLIEMLSDEQAVAHGKDVGDVNAPEITRFWFGKLNLQTFLSLITLYSKYSGIYDYQHASSGRAHTITFHHELGPRYSLVLANYMDQAIRKIVGVRPRFEVGYDSCVVSFEEP